MSQVIGRNATNVVSLAYVNANKLQCEDVAVATLLTGTLSTSDSAVATALGGNLTVSDAAVATALGGNLTVSDSAVATALAGTLSVSDSAVATALGGTLSVSAPVISASSTVLRSAVSIPDGVLSQTNGVDVGGSKSISFFGNLTDTSANIQVEVSADNTTFYNVENSAIYISSTGDYQMRLDVNAQYVRLAYTNGSGVAATWTAISSFKA